MKKLMLAAAACALFSTPAFAEPDAALVKQLDKEFRACRACHMVQGPDGRIGKSRGKVGPNLYGVVGGPAAAVEGFKYSKAMKAANEKGLVWDRESFTAYVAHPTNYLKEYLGEDLGKSRMLPQKRADGGKIYDLLEKLAPAPATN